MNTEKATCKLCGHNVPQAYLHQHEQAERKEIEEFTINFIKSNNPEWTEKDPTCQQCWDYYAKL